MISLFFCLRESRTNRTLVRATGEDHSFADDFSAAEIISKRWASKNCRGQFFQCVVRADFSRPLLWAEKAVNFLNREGQKRGATHSPRQSVFLCTPRSGVKGAKTLLFVKE